MKTFLGFTTGVLSGFMLGVVATAYVAAISESKKKESEESEEEA